MNTRVTLLTAATLTLAGGVAVAQQDGPSRARMNAEAREERLWVPLLPLVGQTITGTAARTTGRGNVLLAQSFDTVTSVDVSSGIAVSQYAGLLGVVFYDDSSDGTLECDSVTLTCLRPNGRIDSETLGGTAAAIGEVSGAVSTNACVRLDRVTASGCSGGATSDQLIVYLTNEVHLTGVRRLADVIALCIYDMEGTFGTTEECIPGSALTLSSGNTINPMTASPWTSNQALAPVEGDSFLFRYYVSKP